MIICDLCSKPVTSDSRVPLPHRDDPYGEIDWCSECAANYTKLCLEFKEKLIAFKVKLATELDIKLKEYFEGLRNE